MSALILLISWSSYSHPESQVLQRQPHWPSELPPISRLFAQGHCNCPAKGPFPISWMHILGPDPVEDSSRTLRLRPCSTEALRRPRFDLIRGQQPMTQHNNNEGGSLLALVFWHTTMQWRGQPLFILLFQRVIFSTTSSLNHPCLSTRQSTPTPVFLSMQHNPTFEVLTSVPKRFSPSLSLPSDPMQGNQGVSSSSLPFDPLPLCATQWGVSPSFPTTTPPSSLQLFESTTQTRLKSWALYKSA